MMCSFFVLDLKIVYGKQLLILDPKALENKGKNFSRHLFGDKIIQNCASKISQEV